MNALLNWLFGCAHSSVTWPRSRNGRCYIVCVDCGKEFAYDWRRMKTGEPKQLTVQVPAPELLEDELERWAEL